MKSMLVCKRQIKFVIIQCKSTMYTNCTNVIIKTCTYVRIKDNRILKISVFIHVHVYVNLPVKDI
jgi:hypothetical protein